MPKILPNPEPTGKPLRLDRALPIEATRLGKEATRDVDRSLTPAEAVSAYARTQAEKIWNLGVTSLDQISRILDISVATLKTWREEDKWPSREEVKQTLADTHTEKVRRFRETMHLKHLEKQDKLIEKGYEILEEAQGNINLARDPVAAAAQLVKAGQTLGKQFLDISGINNPEAKKADKAPAVNIHFLTQTRNPKHVAAESGAAPYHEGET